VRLWLGDGLKQHINSVYNGNPSVLVTVHKHCIFYTVQGETSGLIYTHICSIRYICVELLSKYLQDRYLIISRVVCFDKENAIYCVIST